jgi:hypothetical protein
LVDVVLLQSVSYVAAAIGVCVAAFYYVMMVRFTQRNMRVALTTALIGNVADDKVWRTWLDLLYMEWSDYDDFERKYGTDTGEAGMDNASKRLAVWNYYDVLGNLLRRGLVDRDTLYDAAAVWSFYIWFKFRTVIEEHRIRYGGKDSYVGFEYLVGEMLKMKRERDPNYKVPESFARYVADK